MKTFQKGGVHPPENKLTAHSAIKVLPVPDTIAIPISQHLGVPAIAVVGKGDFVKTGQLIARGEAFISANVHASATGKVVKIGDVPDSSGYDRPAIVIQTEPDQLIKTVDVSPDIVKECHLSPEEIIAKVKEAY